MFVLLPEWSGNVVGAMHRCGITQTQLADSCGMSRKYLCMVLNSEEPRQTTQSKIEHGLKKIITERGFNVEEIYPTTKRPTQRANP